MLDTNPEVASWRLQTKQEAYDKWREAYVSGNDTERRVYRVDPALGHAGVLLGAAEGPARSSRASRAPSRACQGVSTVRDLREVLKPIYFWMNVFKWGAIGIAAFLVFAAILQVGNTIRLAAFARRREIGIMRLVGASSLYIQLPFLMEALVAALVGVALAAGSLMLFMYVVIYRTLRPNSNIVAWVDWGNAVSAIGIDRRDRARADADSDARDDPEIPQSVTTVGYRRSASSPSPS